jgi:hypothetical protein
MNDLATAIRMRDQSTIGTASHALWNQIVKRLTRELQEKARV